MNEMARHPRAIPAMDVNSTAPQPLTELEAFTLLDNTLDDMHKQYLDAKIQRQELNKMMGADDPMTLVAMDMEDSCWCAMQTRYIEVRAMRDMMDKAQSLMRQRDQLINEKKLRILIQDKERRARDFFLYLKVMQIIKEKNKTPNIFEWFAALIFLQLDFASMYNKSQKQAYALVA